MALTNFPNGIAAFPVIGASLLDSFAGSYKNLYFVDGDMGSDGNDGLSPESAKATVQAAVTAAAARNLYSQSGSIIYVKAKHMDAGATDPESYAENIVIPAAGGANTVIVGVSANRTQCGLPQLKVGATTTSPLLTVRAPGCALINMGVNGYGGTGGGILLDDDGSTKTALGFSVLNSHLKNCVGTTATDCRTGGAIMWSANGGAWQVRIAGNVFYKNVGDVVLKGTGVSVPQDVIIENNTFQGLATSVDCHLYLAGGSGMASVTVNNNVFADVLPALGSGSITRYVDMTGCTGIFSNNVVAGSYTTTGFGAAKAAAKIPTTVGIAGNYSDAGLIVREA